VSEKRIARFIMESPNGYFLDLVDAPLSVGIGHDTGDVILHEGRGEGRINHEYLEAKLVRQIDVEECDERDQFRILLILDDRLNVEPHELGITDDRDAALRWATAANEHYGSNGRITLSVLTQHAASALGSSDPSGNAPA